MTKKILILLIIFGIALRFIRLDYSPPHLSNDEISIAYDAYSILHTLRDQHNNFLPLSFESFGTYKAPLLIYLAVPTTALFGNNEYSVRLPSAIFGSLTIILLGFLIYELTKNIRLSLLGTFLLSTTPWHIYSSRMSLESNIALFFVVSGLYLFYHAINKYSNKFALLSLISFAISIYSYHTEWGFTPIILILLFYFNRKIILRRPIFIFGTILFLLLILPIFIDAVQNLETNARANTEIILNDPLLSSKLDDNSLNIFQKGQAFLIKFISNYSSYINLNFLFFSGLHLLPSNDPFQIGLFLTPLLPLFLIGLFKIKDFFKDQYKFVYGWLAVSPIIPSLTIGEANQVRFIVAVAPITIVIAVGFLVIWDYLKRNWRYLLLGIFAIFFLFFLLVYFYHFPYERGENYQYGYKQVAQLIKNNDDLYQKIIIDPRFGDGGIYSGVPHLYIPYFTYLDPNQMQNSKVITNGIALGKYQFRNIDWNTEEIHKGYLYVVANFNSPPVNLLPYLKRVERIQLPNHKDAFAIYEKIE